MGSVGLQLSIAFLLDAYRFVLIARHTSLLPKPSPKPSLVISTIQWYLWLLLVAHRYQHNEVQTPIWSSKSFIMFRDLHCYPHPAFSHRGAPHSNYTTPLRCPSLNMTLDRTLKLPSLSLDRLSAVVSPIRHLAQPVRFFVFLSVITTSSKELEKEMVSKLVVPIIYLYPQHFIPFKTYLSFMMLILVSSHYTQDFLTPQSNNKQLEDIGHAWNFFLIYLNT